MNCEQCRENISFYIDEFLTNEEKALFEEHIKTCESCQLELKETEDLLTALKNIPVEELPKHLHMSIMESVMEEKDRAKSRRRMIASFGTLAASLVLIVGIASAIRSSNNGGGLFENMMNSYDSMSPQEGATAGAPEAADYSMNLTPSAPEAEFYSESATSEPKADTASPVPSGLDDQVAADSGEESGETFDEVFDDEGVRTPAVSSNRFSNVDLNRDEITEAINLLLNYLYPDEIRDETILIEFFETPEAFGCEYRLLDDGEMSNPWRIEFRGISEEDGCYLFWRNEQVYINGLFSHVSEGDFYSVDMVTMEIVLQD